MEIAKTIAPVCLAIIMFGLGLGLTTNDFIRVLNKYFYFKDYEIRIFLSDCKLG